MKKSMFKSMVYGRCRKVTNENEFSVISHINSKGGGMLSDTGGNIRKYTCVVVMYLVDNVFLGRRN